MTQLSTLAPLEPSERRWTREEYYRLAEQGYFTGQRVELIDGRIIQMPPQGLPHTVGVELLLRFIGKAFPDGYRHRVQMPFRAIDSSDPEPGIAVVQGNPRDRTDGHPTSAALIVEVSDTTLRHDRRKAKLYAASGVRDYWILNLLDETLEVYRDPSSEASSSPNALPYASVQILKRDESTAPLAAPGAVVGVAELLP